MPIVRKSAIVPHACETMFDMVDRVEDYPRFLPWCAGAKVLERGDEVTRARIDIDYHGLTSHFTTRNIKRRPHTMSLELIEGPFMSFSGQWRFEPLGANGCRVELAVDYAFSNRALDIALAAMFGHVLESLVDGFVARAESAPPREGP